jgi:hypothetical protein
MGTGDPFSGAKARPGRDADHSPISAEVENKQDLYLLPPSAFVACSGTALTLCTQKSGAHNSWNVVTFKLEA